MEDLVFDLEPGEHLWTVVGPTPKSPVHRAPSPLRNADLVTSLLDLRRLVSMAVPLDVPRAPGAPDAVAALQDLALWISKQLTPVLLSEEARREVVERINAVDQGRARLVIRVGGRGPIADQALALPWELLAPAGTFAVRDGRLDVVREAVLDGAPHLPEPTGPLTVTVTVSAPDDQTRLNYEKESFRLQGALTSLGQRAAFSDLGGVEDFLEVVKGQRASAVHFSGHGLPGELVFEDEQGFSQVVPIRDLVRELHLALPEAGAFPRLFFLASCYGAVGSETGGGLAAALGQGPSTAATLHLSGFVQVVGYFGPVGDELCTRAEETFYGALSQGRTTLHAAAEARASLSRPLTIDGQRVVYPLGWAQLVIYHRGPDRPLALSAGRRPLAQRYQRRTVQVSGLPILETGFVGRRSLQHEIRRRVERDGVRLIVLQGLGGLGKTALASRLLSHTFAPDGRDQLILRGRGLDEEPDPVAILRAQAEEHGKVHGLPQWEERLKRLREETPEPAAGFAATIGELRRDRPGLVLYVDNAETLQDGPGSDDPQALGSWRAGARAWWEAMESLAEEGLVLVSTRYGWKGLAPDSWIPVDPLSPADVLRMLDSFPSFAALPREARGRLASRVDGHPRTLEILDRLVRERLADLGPGYEIADPWEELIEPVLPRHAEEIRADLLLEELWDRLTAAGREHAARLGVLRVPAPRSVIDRLGAVTGELIRTGMLTRFREQAPSEDGAEWVDRWGLHSLVRSFVGSKAGGADRHSAHLVAGAAYEDWVKKHGVDLAMGRAEGIHHLHAAGEGDRAWPMVLKQVLGWRRQARYQEALGLLESCEAAGTTGERLAEALMLQAQVRRHRGERSSGLDRVLERALGLASSDRVRCFVLSEHGSLRLDRKEYAEAEDLIRQAMELKETVFGREHPEYAASLHELAGVMSSQGRYAEAESLLRQSLESHVAAVGEWHPSILPTLTNLADLLAVQGRAAEAEPLASRAVGIALKAYGPDHPDVAQALLGAARLQSILGRREAPETARLALSAFEETLGADHPVTRGAAPTLRRIASGDRLMVGRPDPEMEQRLAQIETMARKVREDAIAALRGEGDRDVLTSALEDMSAGLGRLDGSWHPLATYAGAVAVVLRGLRAPEIAPPLARHLDAVKAAARS